MGQPPIAAQHDIPEFWCLMCRAGKSSARRTLRVRASKVCVCLSQELEPPSGSLLWAGTARMDGPTECFSFEGCYTRNIFTRSILVRRSISTIHPVCSWREDRLAHVMPNVRCTLHVNHRMQSIFKIVLPLSRNVESTIQWEHLDVWLIMISLIS